MKKILVGLSIITIGIAGGWYYLQSQKKDVNVSWDEIQPQIKDIEVKIQSTGVVEPENKVEILPPIAGRIDQIKVEEGDVVKDGQLIALMSSTQRAALLDIARERPLKERKTLEDTYQPTPIFAPVDGRIIKKAIVPGQTVSSQSVLFEMSDRLVVRAQVDETDLAAVKVGMDTLLSVDAYPENHWNAKVVRIAQQSRVLNNVNIYDVLLAFEGEPPARLRSGMTANVDFIIEHKENVLCLPVWAVNSQKQNEAVVTTPQGNTLTIKLGISDGQYVEVSGLDKDQKILVKPINLHGGDDSNGSLFSPRRPNKKRNNK